MKFWLPIIFSIGLVSALPLSVHAKRSVAPGAAVTSSSPVSATLSNADADLPQTSSEPIPSPDGTHQAQIFFPHAGYCMIVLSGRDTNVDRFEQNFPFKVSAMHWLADGQSFVFLAKAHSTSPVHLYESNWQRKLTRDLTPFGGRDVNRFWLSKNLKTLIASIDVDKKEHYERWHIDTISGAVEPVLKRHHLAGNSIDSGDMLEFKPDPITSALPTALRSDNNLNRYNNQQKQTITYYKTRAVTKMIKGQEAFAPEIRDNGDQRLLLLDPSAAIDQNSGMKSKPWTANEKAQIQSLWRQICANIPGLALRAGHGQRLKVVRIGTWKNDEHHFGGAYSYACAGNGALFICDLFFTVNDQAQLPILIHELAHEADLYRHLSMSPEWISLTDPNVAAGRDALAFSKLHGLKNLDDYGAKYFGLPSLYGASDASELLAEWTMSYATGTTPPEKIKNFIEAKVLNPKCDEEIVDRQFLQARQNLIDSKFADAEAELQHVVKVDSNFLNAYYFLCNYYLQKKLTGKAAAASNELIDRVNALHISHDYSSEHAHYNYQHADVLMRMKDYANSQKYLTMALAVVPKNSDFLAAQKILDRYVKNAARLKKPRTSGVRTGASKN